MKFSVKLPASILAFHLSNIMLNSVAFSHFCLGKRRDLLGGNSLLGWEEGRVVVECRGGCDSYGGEGVEPGLEEGLGRGDRHVGCEEGRHLEDWNR